MKKTILFWAVCAFAFIIWKLVFSTEVAKDSLKAVFAPGHELSAAQVKQIEDIASKGSVLTIDNRRTCMKQSASIDPVRVVSS